MSEWVVIKFIWTAIKAGSAPVRRLWKQLPSRITEPMERFCTNRLGDIGDLLGHTFQRNENNRRSWPFGLLFILLSVSFSLYLFLALSWIIRYSPSYLMPIVSSWLCWLLMVIFLIVLPLLLFLAQFWVRYAQQPTGNMEISQGLEKFSEWVCEAIDDDTTTVHVASNTPLLHSFYCNTVNGKAFAPFVYGKDDNWGQLFCTPFIEQLRKCHKKKKLDDFQFLNLFPKRLQNRVPWFPFAAQGDFEDYCACIDRFKETLCEHLGQSIDWAHACFHETHVLPLWIAVIKRSKGVFLMPWITFRDDIVVLALTDRKDLQKSFRRNASVEEKKKEARRIMRQVMVLKGNDPRIVDFFDNVFDRLLSSTMETPETILNFLREASDDGLSVMFRQGYNENMHQHFKPSSLTHVLFSTERTSQIEHNGSLKEKPE